MPHGHCSPQGPGQGAATCPHFPLEHVQDWVGHYPAAPQSSIEASSWGTWLAWRLEVLQSWLQHPSRDSAEGDSLYSWLDLSF